MKDDRTGPAVPELSAVIERLYDVFAGRRPSGPFDVCPCCVEESVADDLHRLPLTALTASHLYAYNTSAKSDPQPPDELRYLLPRLLELVLRGEPVHHSVELFLVRLGNAGPTALTAVQREAVDAAALVQVAQGLATWQEQRPTALGSQSVLTWLLMWHRGGVDVAPLLDRWLADGSTSATLHYVTSIYWDYLRNGRRYTNAFRSEAFADTVVAWVERPEHRAVQLPRVVALLDQGPWPSDLDMIIETVFDWLTGDR